MKKAFGKFWYVFQNTFTTPEYYADVIKAPLSFSLKYFFAYFMLFAGVTSIVLIFRLWIPLGAFLSTLPDEVIMLYPPDLEIKIEDGSVRTNVTEPYILPISVFEPIVEDLRQKVLGENAEIPVENILVIDTNATIDQFETYQTFMLLTKQNLVYLNPRQEPEIVSLKEIGTITLDKDYVTQFAQQAKPHISVFVPVASLVSFIVLAGSLSLSRILYLAVFSLLIMLLARLFYISLSYLKAFQIGLHLVTISTTVLAVIWVIGTSVAVPYLQTIFLSLLCVYIFYTLRKAKQS